MRGIAAYQKVSTQSASSERLLVMLYERAIQDQEEAIALLHEGESVAARPKLQNVRQIFIELMTALDEDEAPELTVNLKRLYIWMVRELVRAGRDSDPVPVAGTLEITRELHAAWVQAVAA